MLLAVISSLALQYLIIAALVAGSAFYVGRLFWRAFFGRSAAGCAKGCGACSTLDVEALQRTIEAATPRPAGSAA